MKAKLTLAKGGIVAWMGGSRPKPITECSADEVALVSLLFREQFKTWHDYWKDYPSRDVARIFWNRARYDAHATMRDLK